jgi:hypothetical protein
MKKVENTADRAKTRLTSAFRKLQKRPFNTRGSSLLQPRKIRRVGQLNPWRHSTKGQSVPDADPADAQLSALPKPCR